MKTLKYLTCYPEATRAQVQKLIAAEKLSTYLMHRYPAAHGYGNDKMLYHYATDIKNRFLQKTPPLSKVLYDGKITLLNDALGLHRYHSRVQGSKLKSKNEIRIASLFKSVPEPFLKMIVVHELAHFKEKEHNKAFYRLCEYMEPEYHRFEFDLRLYLTHLECYGKLY